MYRWFGCNLHVLMPGRKKQLAFGLSFLLLLLFFRRQRLIVFVSDDSLYFSLKIGVDGLEFRREEVAFSTIMASAMCSWLQEIVTLLGNWWWLVSHHYLLVTLAICPWFQITWLTTTTITTWSNVIRQVMLLLITWPSARDLPNNVTNISNVTLLCKSRAHGRCHWNNIQIKN